MANRTRLNKGKFTVVPVSKGHNVTTSSTTVLASNADRTYALIVNDSDEVIYLKLGTTALVNSGIRLSANGGWLEFTENDALWTGIITGIHGGTGNKAVTVTEGDN